MQFSKYASAAVLALLGSQVEAEPSYTPAKAPALPLAVRNPYLNSWAISKDQGPGPEVSGEWPRFWVNTFTAWEGLIRVDGKAYNILGGDNEADKTPLGAVSYTATRSTFNMTIVDKVHISLEFLSPVFPKDLKRQSIPFAYLQVTAESADGKSHNVDLYTDVTGEWTSGDSSEQIEWATTSVDGIRSHTFWKKNQQEFHEVVDQAAWGTWFYSTAEGQGVTYQIGKSVYLRTKFVNEGKLGGTVDKNFRAINDEWPVFAFSRSFKVKAEEAVQTVFSLGIAQKNALQYVGKENAAKPVPSLWTSYFKDEQEMVTFFHKDFSQASEMATDMDLRIQRDSVAEAAQDYATMTTLTVRQVFGGLTFAGTKEEPIIFVKDISTTSFIQTVDVMKSITPFMMYLAPEWIKYMLEPLMVNARAHYPNAFAPHDIGRFPLALGHPKGDDDVAPVEDSSDMIIMSLAYAKRTGDNKFLADNWDLLDKWGKYLVKNTRIPADQLSADNYAGHLAGQVNLALNGILALRAMSDVGIAAGKKEEASTYNKYARVYMKYWMEHAVNQDKKHTMLQYDKPDSFGLLYNLYADKLLGLNFVPPEIYNMQSDYYKGFAAKFGFPLDSRNIYTRLDWQLFCAAIASGETKTMFISKIAGWINTTPTWRALTDLYDASTGDWPSVEQHAARPVVGGVFALLALH